MRVVSILPSQSTFLLFFYSQLIGKHDFENFALIKLLRKEGELSSDTNLYVEQKHYDVG